MNSVSFERRYNPYKEVHKDKSKKAATAGMITGAATGAATGYALSSPITKVNRFAITQQAIFDNYVNEFKNTIKGSYEDVFVKEFTDGLSYGHAIGNDINLQALKSEIKAGRTESLPGMIKDGLESVKKSFGELPVEDAKKANAKLVNIIIESDNKLDDEGKKAILKARQVADELVEKIAVHIKDSSFFKNTSANYDNLLNQLAEPRFKPIAKWAAGVGLAGAFLGFIAGKISNRNK